MYVTTKDSQRFRYLFSKIETMGVFFCVKLRYHNQKFIVHRVFEVAPTLLLLTRNYWGLTAYLVFPSAISGRYCRIRGYPPPLLQGVEDGGECFSSCQNDPSCHLFSWHILRLIRPPCFDLVAAVKEHTNQSICTLRLRISNNNHVN